MSGTMVALISSLIAATQAEGFWPMLMTVLAFSMTVGIVVTWLTTVASRKPNSKT